MRAKNLDVYNKTLNDAIQSIYRVYGSNLAAFFRDVEDPVAHGEGKSQVYGYLPAPQVRKPHKVNPAR